MLCINSRYVGSDMGICTSFVNFSIKFQLMEVTPISSLNLPYSECPGDNNVVFTCHANRLSAVFCLINYKHNSNN